MGLYFTINEKKKKKKKKKMEFHIQFSISQPGGSRHNVVHCTQVVQQLCFFVC